MDAKPNIVRGIALSAPAILTKHEFIQISSHQGILKKNLSKKKPRFKSQKLHHTKSAEQLDFSSRDILLNLPEFIDFQSDHLLISPLINDRLRSLSTFQTSKFPRQSPLPQTTTTTTITTATNNPSISSPTKRLSRSRHSCDISNYHEKQQKYSHRVSMNAFDSMSCFNEVRTLEVFIFCLVYSSIEHLLPVRKILTNTKASY